MVTQQSGGHPGMIESVSKLAGTVAGNAVGAGKWIVDSVTGTNNGPSDKPGKKTAHTPARKVKKAARKTGAKTPGTNTKKVAKRKAAGTARKGTTSAKKKKSTAPKKKAASR
ncbi:MAG: hypothetical protein ACYSWW_05310 [Planctomycetota bacterium]